MCNIDNHSIEDARRILTLLCFAARPLKVSELIDGVAVEVNGATGLNRKRRLQDVDDIRYICPGLIDIVLDSGQLSESSQGEEFVSTVRIAHFSVQEYLKSSRIVHQRAAFFNLNSIEANAEIAKICLTYLLEHDLSHSISDKVLVEEFPLAQFAAEYWHHHYRNTARPSPQLDDLILTLFQNRHAFTTSVKLCNMDAFRPTVLRFDLRSDQIASPVYYASLLGLDQILPALIDNKQEGDLTVSAQSKMSTSSRDLNAQNGLFGNALQAASWSGHEKIVQMLLGKGAEINTQGGHFSNALQAASWKGHDNIVRILLEKGAEVNVQGGDLGNALQGASCGGHDKIVQMLVEKGAEINAESGCYGNALQAASFGGHEETVQLLLRKGANVNDQNGLYGSALQAALFRGKEAVVQMLLQCGAAIDLRDMQGRCPFHFACAKGKMDTVKLLSSLTQDRTVVDAQGRNSLHHAASRGSTEVVKWLLKEGFCPNEADRDGWSPLHWAAKNGNVDTIAALMSAGARCTTERIEGWTPDLIAIYHHNQFPSPSPSPSHHDTPHEHTTSELASQESIDSSATTMGLKSKGQESSARCDGCMLVSLGCNGYIELDRLTQVRVYGVHATNVRTVGTSTFVSNANIHPMKPTLITLFT